MKKISIIKAKVQNINGNVQNGFYTVYMDIDEWENMTDFERFQYLKEKGSLTVEEFEATTDGDIGDIEVTRAYIDE